MNIKTIFLALGVIAITTAADSAIYRLTFNGPDFNSLPLRFDVEGNHPGDQGFTGGPAQTWGFTTSTNGGWLDFYSNGTTIALEGGTNVLFLQSANRFYKTSVSTEYNTIYGPRELINISLDRSDQPIELSNIQWPPNGNTDTLSVTVVPEISTWLMILTGFVLIGYRNRRCRNDATSFE